VFRSDGENSLHSLLMQIMRHHFIRAHHLLSKIGLYKGQPPILSALWDRDGLTITELAEAVEIRPATVTVMVKRMEKAGLLVRRSDLNDMRICRVYLTQKGMDIRSDVEHVWETIAGECFAGFTPEERDLLQRFLKRIRDNLQDANSRG